MTEPRLVIADDQPVFVQGLHATLRDRSEFTVVGAAQTMDDFITLLGFSPDAILASERFLLRALDCSRAVIGLVAKDLDEAARCMRLGVAGIICRNIPVELMVSSICVVLGGMAIFPDWATPGWTFIEGLPEFSDQEIAAWRLVALGWSDKEIGRELGLSERSAKRLVGKLVHSTGARNRVHVAALAGRYGLTSG